MDCEWSDYSAWSTCSATCGGGQQGRSKYIQRPAVNGGKECTGEAAESRNCGEDHCPGDIRSHILNSLLNYVDNYFSILYINTFHLTICLQLSTVNCEWNDFGNWSACNQDCGGGWQRRSRTVKQKAEYGGIECNGCAAETRACNTHLCPSMAMMSCIFLYNLRIFYFIYVMQYSEKIEHRNIF